MKKNIEKSSSNISSRIAKFDEKQDSLLACILGLGKLHIMELLDSRLKYVQAELSYNIALAGLGIAIFAIGFASFAIFGDILGATLGTIIMIFGFILLVFALIMSRRLKRDWHAMKEWMKEAEGIMHNTQQLMDFLTSEWKDKS